MRKFAVALLIVALLGCICLDRYLTWTSLEEIKDADATNLREMVRISIVALSQKGATDALIIAKQLGEQLELQTKVNKEMGTMLRAAWQEIEALKDRGT